MESTFMDDGNFFDQIDDLLEFPPENECINNNDLIVSDDDCKEFPSIWNEDNIKNTDSLFFGFNGNSVSDLSTEISVPYDDIIQLEWLSTFVEDSFSGGGMTLAKDTLLVNNKDTSLVNKDTSKNTFKNTFHTSSPVSVLESSSCSSNSNSSSSCSNSGIKTIPVGPNHRCAQRARSKRPRPATFSPRTMSSIQLMPSSSGDAAHSVPGSDAKKKKPKPKIPSLGQKSESNNNNNQNMIAATVRKCLHCEITKTPQWRAGPLGPKTLCNACGVRYKSGRLFPEYRPAASPTFVPSIHSNSHKKVVEMRSNLAE